MDMLYTGRKITSGHHQPAPAARTVKMQVSAKWHPIWFCCRICCGDTRQRNWIQLTCLGKLDLHEISVSWPNGAVQAVIAATSWPEGRGFHADQEFVCSVCVSVGFRRRALASSDIVHNWELTVDSLLCQPWWRHAQDVTLPSPLTLPLPKTTHW